MPRKFLPGFPLTALLLIGALGLSGCSTTKPAAPKTAQAPAKRTAAGKRPALPPAGSGRGGYYLDDGPGDNPPDDLESLADAIPRLEPYSKRGNSPYVVFGKTYTPFTDERPYKVRGHGSWYGKKFHGNKTSSGELYDMYQMTAAHPTLPIPSYARVTHVASGRQVIVRVNDRGPFLAGRVIDLSYSAALKLGYLNEGSAELEVERLLPAEITRLAAARREEEAGASAAPTQVASAAQAFEAGAEDRKAVEAITAVDNRSADNNFYLQLGAFTRHTNAAVAHNRLSRNWLSDLPQPELAQSGELYRIYSGPFASRDRADAAAAQLHSSGMAQALIVQR